MRYITSVVLAVTVITTMYHVSLAAGLAGPTTLSGWAWSSTTGWISMNCSNTTSCASDGGVDYEVAVDGSGLVSGYAWSSNLGWVRFGGLSGCPSGSCDAQIDSVTGEVTGWARVCSAGMYDSTITSYDILKRADFDVSSYATLGTLHSINTDPSGSNLYLVHSNGAASRVIQFALGTPFDVTTAAYATEFRTGGSPVSVDFNDDGSIMFVGDNAAQLESYTLGTNYDVSTAVLQHSVSLAPHVTDMNEVEFISAAGRVFVASGVVSPAADRHVMAEFSISGDDITTISHVQNVQTPFQSPDIGFRHDGFEFNTDGTRLIMETSNVGQLSEYTLSTPYDLSTVTLEDSVSFTGAPSVGHGIAMRSDGLRLVTLNRDGGGALLEHYDLEEPYDMVGTKTISGSTDCLAGNQNPNAGDWDGWISLSCSNDATCGSSNYQWTMDDTGIGSGYGWGDTVVGWVDFSGVYDTTGGTDITVDAFSASPGTVDATGLYDVVTFNVAISGIPTGETVSYRLQIAGMSDETGTVSTDGTLVIPVADVPYTTNTATIEIDMPEPGSVPEINETNTRTTAVALTAPAPEMTLTPSTEFTRRGGDLTVDWSVSAPYDVTCELLGPGVSESISVTGGLPGAPTSQSDTETITNLENTAEFVLRCGTDEVRRTVEVIPDFQEI